MIYLNTAMYQKDTMWLFFTYKNKPLNVICLHNTY